MTTSGVTSQRGGDVDRKPLLSVPHEDNEHDDDEIEFKQRRTGAGVELRYGLHGVQGYRASMEDRHVALAHPQFTQTCKTTFDDGVERSFFAVYDGHGGHVCAEYTRRHLHTNFASEPTLREQRNPEAALCNAVLRTDQAFLDAARSLNLHMSSGTCAVMAYFEDDAVYVANVGDSRAVVSSAGKAVALSIDHKPEHPRERRRIIHAGGFVARSEMDAYANNPCCLDFLYSLCSCLYSGPMRIYPGGLAVSRSLGDLSLKDSGLLIAEPDVVTRRLTGDDEFIILACDGLWDVMSNQMAVDLVRREITRAVDPDLTQVAKYMAQAAVRKGSTDNVSVIIIDIRVPAVVLI